MWEDDGGGEGDILQITSKPTTTLSQIQGGADVADITPALLTFTTLTFLGIKANPAFPIHCQPLPCIVLPPCLEAGGPLRLRPRIKSFGPFHLSFMTKTSQPFAEPLKIGQFTITLLHHLGKVRSRLSQLVSNCPEVGDSSSNFWGF